MLAAALVPFLVAALEAPPAAPPAIAPPDSLQVEGAPPIPAALADAVRPFTEFRGATFLSWSPAKRELVMATRFADTVQLHRVKEPLGARTQLTFFPDRVASAAYPRVAAKGARPFLVFSKDTGGSEFFQNYRLDLDGHTPPTLLTDGKSRNSLGVFANRGERLAYTSTRCNGADSDIYVVDPRDSKTDRLVAEVKGGGWSVADWSPDDARLLLREMISVNESFLWSLDLATGRRTPLTPRPEGEKVAYGDARWSRDGVLYVTTDRDGELLRLARLDPKTGRHDFLSSHIPWDLEAIDLSSDGRTLAAIANENGAGRVHLFDLRTGKERPAPLLPPGSVNGLGWHANGRELAVTLGSARMAADVFVVDARTGRAERWTESELGGVDVDALPEPALVKWKSFDGRELSGLLYRPPATFTGKRPVIVSIHGGPEGQSRPIFQGRNNYLLTQLGVALLYPNVRGSTGYGKSFTKLDNGTLREDSVKDIGALLDWIATDATLDADRIMVTGGSYGGYMSLAVATHYAPRIRCSVDIVGISNFVTFLERTEAYRRDLRRVEYGDERDPAMRAFLEKISPLNNAARIAKPILVAQGKNDPRVPLHEAEQIVATLRKRNVPVWYLMARDEGHGFAKKRNADHLFYTLVTFANRYLLDQPAPR